MATAGPLGRVLVCGRGVARLATSGGQEKNISSFFLILLLLSPIFPQFSLVFFLNLVLRVGEPPTRKDPGYATGLWGGRIGVYIGVHVSDERAGLCGVWIWSIIYAGSHWKKHLPMPYHFWSSLKCAGKEMHTCLIRPRKKKEKKKVCLTNPRVRRGYSLLPHSPTSRSFYLFIIFILGARKK